MKNEKGFTIVELVIVIAVVAVLAGVLIPTFSAIVKNANVSADTQAVRNMNVTLSAEVAEGSPPAGGHELIVLLEENGFSQFRPQTKFYTFYWLKNDNVIILADEDDGPVYPEEYVGELYDPENWIDLEIAAGMPPAPTLPENPDAPQTFNVSVRTSGASVKIDFGIDTTAVEGQPFRAEILLPEEYWDKYAISKVSAIMAEGDVEHKYTARTEIPGIYIVNEPAVIEIPCVSGDIVINVSIKEYCLITLNCNPAHMKDEISQFEMRCQKGSHLLISTETLERFYLKDGYRLAGASGTVSGRDLGDIYNEEKRWIDLGTAQTTGDIVLDVTTEWKTYKINLVTNVLFDGPDDVYKEEITISYPDNSCYFDVGKLLGDKTYKNVHYYFLPERYDKELHPTIEYDDVNGKLTVTDPKYDLTVYYFVEFAD